MSHRLGSRDFMDALLQLVDASLVHVCTMSYDNDVIHMCTCVSHAYHAYPAHHAHHAQLSHISHDYLHHFDIKLSLYIIITFNIF